MTATRRARSAAPRKVSVNAPPERSLRRSMTSAGRSSIIEAYRKRLQQEAELRRPKGPVMRERQYSYASLNEFLLTVSLTRSVQKRQWRHAIRILVGWLLNLALFVSLILVFAVYGCVFAGRAGDRAQDVFDSWLCLSSSGSSSPSRCSSSPPS